MAVNPQTPIRRGSRGSPLALAQAHLVGAMLAKGNDTPAAAFTIATFMTSGDRIRDRLLQDAGGKGLFTRELDRALLDGEIDAGVHSMKDLPTRMPEGIVLACVPAREEPADVFISPHAGSVMDLKPGAVMGTASLRRQAQTLHLRPDLIVKMLRGRVETRLRRIAEGAFDATYLALAGLRRLNLEAHATSVVDMTIMPPAPGQGALAVTVRADDTKTLERLAALNVAEYAIATTAERAFLEALDGSCRTPIAALATARNGELSFLGEVLTVDGKHCWHRQASVRLGADPYQTAREMGLKLGTEIRAEAGSLYEKVTAAAPW
jgi:hydroxymethylbilane synthase